MISYSGISSFSNKASGICNENHKAYPFSEQTIKDIQSLVLLVFIFLGKLCHPVGLILNSSPVPKSVQSIQGKVAIVRDESNVPGTDKIDSLCILVPKFVGKMKHMLYM